jgi:hypothetical protein
MMDEREKPQDETGGGFEPGEGRRHTGNLADDKHPVPLFLRGRSDGRQDDAQDEKDGSAE